MIGKVEEKSGAQYSEYSRFGYGEVDGSAVLEPKSVCVFFKLSVCESVSSVFFWPQKITI